MSNAPQTGQPTPEQAPHISPEQTQQLGEQLGEQLHQQVLRQVLASQRQRERQAYIAAALPALIAGTFQRQQGTPLSLVRAYGSTPDPEATWPELLSHEEMEHIATQAFLLAENVLICIDSEDAHAAHAGQG